jgi:hypothetical protein
MKMNSTVTTCLRACFLLGLLFDPESGADIFFRNVGYILMKYMVLYPREKNSSRLTP